MKLPRFPILLALAWPLLASAAPAADAAPQPRAHHPYLFFTAERVASLKDRIAHDPQLAEKWNALLAGATRTAEQPALNPAALETLGLAYCMTGDRKLAEKIRDTLLRECRRPDWGEAELLRRDPPWHAALGTARSLNAVAVGFDCIHDFLTADERRQIAKAIVDLGVQPTLDDWVLGHKRIHSLDTMGHNWWSACVFSAGVGAIAVFDEEPRAAGWLSRISAGSLEWFGYAGSLLENKPATFDAAGGFYESVNYANFALGEYLRFRLAWTNAFRAPAPPDIPLLARVGDFFLHTSYPTSHQPMSLDFGDGSLGANGTQPVALLWALGDHQPRYLWYLNANQQAQFREGIDRGSPLGLVYLPDDAAYTSAPATPDLPPSKLFPGIGWATLRSSWDKDATLLGVKSGYTWNHSHADEGSFILFHRGENLLIDSGNPSYTRPEYDEYYRQSRAHNVVLFNGEAENPEDTYFGSKFPGSVSQLIDTGDLKYLLADATGPTSKNFVRNYRHFLWVGDVILVIDDVESFVPGQFEWLLHVGGKAVRRGLDLTVTQGAAAILVRPLFPEPFPDAGLPSDYPEKMRLVEKSGFEDHQPDNKVVYYAFQPAELTRRTKFLTAITLVTEANQKQLPQLERLQGPNLMGVRIRQNGTTTDVRLNLLADNRIRHRNANTKVDGWETDAYLTAMTFRTGADPTNPDAAERIFVADGSYLRRDGKVILDSLSKVYATWTPAAPAWDVVLQGQPLINAAIHAAKPPTVLRLNGQTTVAPYDPAEQQLTLSLHRE